MTIHSMRKTSPQRTTKMKLAYPLADSFKVAQLVRKKYDLSTSAMRVYNSLSELECLGLGFCEPITVNYKELSKVSTVNPKQLKKALVELDDKKVCEVVIGSDIKIEHKATRVRRFSIDELKSSPRYKLIDTNPESAKQLAEHLNNKSIHWGNESIKPTWNPQKTGRVYSSNPNIQSESSSDRKKKLNQAYDCVIDLDLKSADPTIIKHLIGFDTSNLYNKYQELGNCSRSDAKTQVNMLAYCDNSVSVMKHWDNYLHSIFIPYAEALDDYKNKLWNSGKPIGKRKAFVYTLNKTKITDTNNGKKIHKGNLLNWLVQGTIADVINQTSLDLINQEFNYLFPVHDSFYINANKSAIDSIINILNNRLQIIGLEMDSEIKIIN